MTVGSIKATSLEITAYDIVLNDQTEATQDVKLHHQGGTLSVPDNLKVGGDLAFYLPEGLTFGNPRTAPGGLSYILSEYATQKITFLADQKAGKGLTLNTPTAVQCG